MRKIKDFIIHLPKYFWVLAICTGASQFIVYYLPRVLHASELTLLSSDLDAKIPVVPGFIYIYVLAFVYWVASYAYIYLMNKPVAYRLFTADAICKIVCVLCFCLYPCTMERPANEDIVGFGSWLMKFIYWTDEPTQLLPSMHCYISVLLAIPLFSKYAEKAPMWVKIASPIFAILVCLSTLFVKQHVLADVYTGAGLALVSWFMAVGIWKIVDNKKGAAN